VVVDRTVVVVAGLAVVGVGRRVVGVEPGRVVVVTIGATGRSERVVYSKSPRLAVSGPPDRVFAQKTDTGYFGPRAAPAT
jgi:hypothetical protein